jgi:beta-ureidopropionase
MVLVVPIYEVEMTGVLYNTASVFDADCSYLGKISQAPELKAVYHRRRAEEMRVR